MKTLIINGSPKGKNGNTEVIINRFIGSAKDLYQVCYVANEDRMKLAEYIKKFDSIIIVMPLYIHAMPGIVMKLIECMEPTTAAGKSMGFIVQSGFRESEHSMYLKRYLGALAKELNYTYIGTVVRGGSAGISMMPEKMNRKLFEKLQVLGEHFEATGTFHADIMEKLAKPIRLSKGMSRLLHLLFKLGISDTIFWNGMLKKNNALDRKFDRPFA